MPRTYSTEAVVLGSHKLGDADRVVTLFTRDHGKTPAVVKGVRKIRSRFGGRLEPFTHLAVQLHEGRNLHTLTGADTIRTHAALRDDSASLRAGLAFVDMLGRATAEFERRPRTFNLVINYLDVMEKLRSEDTVAASRSPAARQGMISSTLGAELKLLLLTGFLPHLANCASCGAEDYLPRFSAQAGGALCENCSAESFDVSRPALETMRRFLEKPLSESAANTLTMESASEVWNCIREICRYHLGVDLRVKPW